MEEAKNINLQTILQRMQKRKKKIEGASERNI